jgi:hypothetical protein
MPVTIRVIHANDFLKVTAEGELDLEQSTKLLMEIVSATDLVNYEVVLDTRKAHSSLSVTDLWYLAAQVADFCRNLPRKTAVLCPRDRFDHAEFFSLCAQNRGTNMRAFTSYEEAMDWLISNEAEPATASSSGQAPAID